MANKVISGFLCLVIVFVGLGAVSLSPYAQNYRFSELCAPLFSTISNIFDKAYSLVIEPFFDISSNTLDTSALPDFDLSAYVPTVISHGVYSSYDHFLYTVDIKTHGSYHSCYCLCVCYNDTNRPGDGLKWFYVVVYDPETSYNLEGWTFARHKFLLSDFGNTNSLSHFFEVVARSYKHFSQSDHTYSSLSSSLPSGSLFSFSSVSSGGGSGGSGPETSGGPGEPGWDEGVYVG